MHSILIKRGVLIEEFHFSINIRLQGVRPAPASGGSPEEGAGTSRGTEARARGSSQTLAEGATE